MSNFDWCKTCGNLGWLDSHKCPPVWEVEIDGGSSFEVYAPDAEEAAAKGAEKVDCDGDYNIIRAGSATALVRRPGGEAETFDIEAESVPHYSARLRS